LPFWPSADAQAATRKQTMRREWVKRVLCLLEAILLFMSCNFPF
jgi:hypothetical protein